jgi:uncharacterized protein (DUF2336 family)
LSTLSENQKPTLLEMEEWARNPSEENWRNLLRVLTDIYVSGIGEGSIEHGDAYADVACRLLDEVAVEVRAELSARVAPLAQFPDRVVLRLAHDEDDSVAAPVLQESPVLSEQELLSIVEMMLPARSLAISKRPTLDKKLTGVLVGQGDSDVIRSVAANHGASFSDQTYRKVAEKAKSDQTLRESLVDRGDMTPAVVVQLTPFLDDELKRRLRSMDSEESGSLLDSLNEITNEAPKKPISRSDRVTADVAIEQIRTGAAKLDETVTKMSSGGHLETLCMVIAAIAELPDAMVMSAFSNTNGNRLAIICKGMGLSSSTFTAVGQLRAKRAGIPSSVSLKYIESYTKLSSSEAAKTLKTLQAESAAAKK